MNQLIAIAAISTLLLMAVACDRQKASENTLVTAENGNRSTESKLSDQKSQDKPQGVSPTLAKIPPLTAPTNPEQRLAQISQGSRDPFSHLQTDPIIIPVTLKSTPAPVPTQPAPLPVQPITPPPPPQEPVVALPTLQPIPNLPVGAVPQIEPLPAPSPAQPILGAEAVQVTGVAELPDGMRAIVKAPDEPTSRYVVEGESLSNGTIRVKRIEIASSGPIVVLEENGKEVIKTVSDRP